ncbi:MULTISPECIES: hypothetical protein [Actinomadura]|uniref:Uncharacterized protein n=1 Tax=Actinomadura yumaensis TaxID=111807 RepID=A0ABW2CMW5_9ACTN|nr:hypothetical protein [Actinomadura sp. J1-007]MWK38822.1 hypothetical protein [Actinomadura sp. J1-007]
MTTVLGGKIIGDNMRTPQAAAAGVGGRGPTGRVPDAYKACLRNLPDALDFEFLLTRRGVARGRDADARRRVD